MESTENRYAHLLQPIRELTKNWDIDVASELNDYLEELDEMCITFDGGKTQLNFAEAALLIQGTACIYSKKVELLHSLVYRTLEYINDRNKKREKQAAASKEDDGAAGGQDAEEDEDAFSPLDTDMSENSVKVDNSATVSVAPLPPESLMPPEPQEKQKLPLISVKGDVLCSQKDFRINVFLPGDEDMILLTLGSCAARFLLGSVSDAACPIGAEAATDVGGGADADAGGADAGGGDAAPEENFHPLDNSGMEMDQDPEEHVDRHQATPGGRVIGLRRRVEEERPSRKEDAPPAVNIWTLNDPFAVLPGDKPFESGKCYRVPDGLDDGGKRKRKQSSLQDFRSWFRGIFDPPERKLKNGPSFTDLNYVYLTTMKDKLKTRKRICSRAGVMVSDDELRRTFLQPEEAGPQQQGEEPVGLLDENDSDEEHQAFPDDVPAELLGGHDFISAEAQRDDLSYEDLVKLRVEQLVVNCRGYTQETALSRRVHNWENKIRPELAQQEQQPMFSIHEYGNKIVSSLSGVGQRRSFSSVVCGLSNYEACKYLLASLQLANDYTVELDSADGLEESLDSMGLTLLSTHRATDRFKTLQDQLV